MKSLKSVGRDRGSEIRNCDASLYRNLINLDRSRAIEKLLKFKTRVLTVEPAIDDKKGGFQHKEARWIKVDIEETESFLIDRELSRMR